MSALRAPSTASVPARMGGGEAARAPGRIDRSSSSLLPAHVARLGGFVALAGFGALQWAQMVRPAASGALLVCVVTAAVAGALLAAVARREPSAQLRAGATLLAGLVIVLVALTAAGVPLRLLGPRGWDDLAGGIAQGLGAVSTVRTPYSGLEEWTRIVLVLGGCALAGVAALLAFAPRRGGAFGVPTAAAVALGALYMVPVMQHDVRLPYLAGLLFALLLTAFLWLERVQRASGAAATALVAVAALGGVAAAPSIDGERALLDYEELAQSLSASTTTQYRWNHDYGPLDWPRDGREVLRVRAPQRAYWKAVNLVAFDGLRWVQDTGQAADPLETKVFDRSWVQRIRVTLRALRTSRFVAAGSTLDITDAPRRAMSNTPGVYESEGEPLRRGHAYRALVYTPRPTTSQLRRSGSAYDAVPRGYGVMRLPLAVGARSRGAGGRAVVFPWWSEGGPPILVGPGAGAGAGADATAALELSPYSRVHALARRLRAGAATPLEYVRTVERYLAGVAFSYTETPPRSRAPLADFLLRDRAGYCQQFSGAMALLLRMGGVPARVATGFSPGALDGERREYVVRDTDAHSWVEVFVPGVGWVLRDPTPPVSPARAQINDVAEGGEDSTVAFGGSERALGRTPEGASGAAPAAPARDGGPSTLVVAAVGLGALSAGAALVALLVRRRRRGGPGYAGVDGDLAELHRALRRSGRTPPAQMTLDALARRLDGTPAQDYVRTLADARYGYGHSRPTGAQRAALRRELGAGLGLAGWLRAWWALPPRLTRDEAARPAQRRPRSTPAG